MQFQQGNRVAAKPKWALAEIRQFQRDLVAFGRAINYTPAELAKALSYSTVHVRYMMGHYKSRRKPSGEFIRRLAAFKATHPTPKPKFVAALAFCSDQTQVPLAQVLAHAFQCPECVREWKRGLREEWQTWWWGRSAQQKYHSKGHREQFALRKRRAANRQRRAARRQAKRREEGRGVEPNSHEHPGRPRRLETRRTHPATIAGRSV